jgi:hypothetical protein
MKQQTQQYNDGVASVYKVDNIANPGKTPVKGLTLKVGPLRYEERTVGMSRYWTAMQAQVKINQILRMPRINNVSTQDVVIPIDGIQYEIKQVQYPPDVVPPSMDLSLEKVVTSYAIG